MKTKSPKSKKARSPLGDLLEAINHLGFKKRSEEHYSYSSAGGYVLTLTVLESGPIVDYGPDITVHHKSACRLNQPEGLVVLHCVIQLLERGYAPKRIELEKTWKLGHKEKGRLDILLRDPKGATFAMIECKTWGDEYTQARNKLLEDGGQLFSYFIQDRSARSLYLYASTFTDAQFKTRVEFTNTSALSGSNIDEVFVKWDKVLSQDGLFAPSAALYELSFRNLKASELKDLDRDTGKGLFHSFAKTLRRHTLSDKSNAFNRIFNLFVCKIADEDACSPEDEPLFQWRADDSVPELLKRLQALYVLGLKNYLDITVDPEYFNALAEFSFIDVFDGNSFRRNAAVLKEVVQLLQSFRLRYSARHQFLGDFFEMLLNTGLKQEVGQYFTPVPLARFIVKSLPLDQIIQQKIASKDTRVLPYVLDYACGSGHFLTGAIEEIHEALFRIERKTLTKQALTKLVAEETGYLWTREYMYGIDEDYRLAKTTKIATFMNGDGDATVIHGNALGSFYSSSSFRGRLRTEQPKAHNPVFDIVVSNPPFAVSNFLSSLPNAQSDFEIAKVMSADSGEIECLFMERTGQVLGEGGVAGIIMPLSILSGTQQTYIAVRRMLLLRFEIKGLVELRDKAFSASTSATVCLFIRKRKADTITAARTHLSEMVRAVKQGKVADRSLQKFSDAYPRQYKKLIETDGTNGETVDLATAFLLNEQASCVVSYSGDKRAQEGYLGYRFSSARGKEGIQLVTNDDQGRSFLYSETDRHDAATVSTQIRRNFENQPITIPNALASHCTIAGLNELADYNNCRIANPSSRFIEHSEVQSNSPFGDFVDAVEHKALTIGELMAEGQLELIKGLTYPKSSEVPYATKTVVLTADSIDLHKGELIPKKQRYLAQGHKPDKAATPKAGDVVISIASGSLAHLGKVAFVSRAEDAYVGGFLSILRPKSAGVGKALFYNLLSERFRRFVALLKDQNINNLPPHELKQFVVLLPKDIDSFVEDAEQKEAKMRLVVAQGHQLRQV